MILSLTLAVSAVGTLTDGQLIRGDVNGDNAVNMKDVLVLRKYIAGLDVAFAEHSCEATAAGEVICGNVNGDDAVNMKDVLLMRKYLAGLDVTFAEHTCNQPTQPPTTVKTNPPTTVKTDPPTTTTTVYIPNEQESDPKTFDLVTLSFNNSSASDYGVMFHSYSTLGEPMVQIVEGDTDDPAAFANATEIEARSRSASTKEWDNYDLETYEFDYDWSRRGSMTTPITTYFHKAKLTGLKYSTTYSYRVGNKLTDTWSPIYTFTTRPETVGDFSFIYTADTQPDLGDKKAYVGMNMLFNKAFTTAPNAAFMLSGGDFIYCSEEGQGAISQWRNVINGCNNFNVDAQGVSGGAGSLFAEHPWMVANGNHDNNVLQNFFNNVTVVSAKQYFSFDYGNTHIIFLDSGLEGNIDSVQQNWLAKDLAETNQKFKMVFLHWSFYCHNQRDLKGSSRDVTKLFDQYGVDFVVSGHVNTDFYTTYPVKNAEVATKESTLEGDTNYFAGGAGSIYLQNGASGLGSDMKEAGRKGALYGNGTTWGQLMLHPIRAGIESSFMVVDVTSNKLTLNRYYLDKSLNVQRYDVGQVGVVRN